METDPRLPPVGLVGLAVLILKDQATGITQTNWSGVLTEGKRTAEGGSIRPPLDLPNIVLVRH